MSCSINVKCFSPPSTPVSKKRMLAHKSKEAQNARDMLSTRIYGISSEPVWTSRSKVASYFFVNSESLNRPYSCTKRTMGLIFLQMPSNHQYIWGKNYLYINSEPWVSDFTTFWPHCALGSPMADMWPLALGKVDWEKKMLQMTILKEYYWSLPED